MLASLATCVRAVKSMKRLSAFGFIPLSSQGSAEKRVKVSDQQQPGSDPRTDTQQPAQPPQSPPSEPQPPQALPGSPQPTDPPQSVVRNDLDMI